jgi:cobalt/nickel transport system permease protein
MHIPDGYLSPATDLVMGLLVLPFWVRGIRKLRQTANTRRVPVIALFAALSFVIMMFNVPVPGGTTVHAVGGALAAIILGPETATIVISIALLIQAFFFGDGGILAFGANCFNMAVVLPYVASAIYRAVAGGHDLGSKRRMVGAALGGWAGLTVAAFFAGLEFGIQPALFHTANGTPLYAPYPLGVAIPAMVISHALVASPVEGLLTALVVAYLQRANRPALVFSNSQELTGAAASPRRFKWLWIALPALVVAAPLGLLAPGTAWGEWNAAQLASRGLGFIPRGLGKLTNLWNAPLAGYDLPALHSPTLGYVLSAGVGVLLVVFLAWLFTTLLSQSQPGHG